MKHVAVAIALLVITAGVSEAQRRGGGPPGGPGGPGRGARGGGTGTVERITVRGKALEGNADVDSPDRAVTVYLPPAYAADQNRRFPVVYLLHGTGGNETGFLEAAGLQQSADRLAGAQGFSQFIVVTPSVATAGRSGVYAPAWERFVAEDLVAYIDGKYRTLAHRMSRGLAGHETGATAAFRIAMTRPQQFANVYAMSVSDAAGVTKEIDKYASNLNAYFSIALDVGAADPAVESNRTLHAALTKLRIAHTFEAYDGDRANRLRERIERHVLPFFARNLASPANLTSPSPEADRLASPGR